MIWYAIAHGVICFVWGFVDAISNGKGLVTHNPKFHIFHGILSLSIWIMVAAIWFVGGWKWGLGSLVGGFAVANIGSFEFNSWINRFLNR